MPIGIKGFQKGHKRLYSDEVKLAMKGRKCYWAGKKRDDPEYIKKISEAHKGQHSSPETQFKKTEVHCHDVVGGSVAYRNLHKWVARKLGKPDTCSKCGKPGLTARQIHWANISGEYKRDLTDWIRLCVKCHYAVDSNRHITNKTT